MPTTTLRESRLNIRCNSHARALLDRAAHVSRVSVSEFVLTHALSNAEKVIREQESITLKPEDFAAFLSALDGKGVRSRPNAALKKAFKRHAAQVRG